jgi:hypothetical protein
MKLQWQEPAEFTRAVARSKGAVFTLWQQVLLGIGAAVVVVLLTAGFEWFFFWLHKKDLGVPTYFYFVAPVIAGVTAGFFPYMLSRLPATIILTEKGIHRNKAIGSEMHVQLWPWATITGLAVEEVEYAGETFPVLVVNCRDQSGEILLGLGDAPVDKINDFVSQMGKNLVLRG